MEDAIIRSRIDKHVKDDANRLFNSLGITMSEAIRLFLCQAVSKKAIPFKIAEPNRKTRKAIEDSTNRKTEETTKDELRSYWSEFTAN